MDTYAPRSERRLVDVENGSLTFVGIVDRSAHRVIRLHQRIIRPGQSECRVALEGQLRSLFFQFTAAAYEIESCADLHATLRAVVIGCADRLFIRSRPRQSSAPRAGGDGKHIRLIRSGDTRCSRAGSH